MSPDDFANFAIAFKSILFEGAPFILLGTLLSGFLGVYLPAGAMEKMLPKNKTAAVLVSGLLGLILPVCECAVVPVIRRLVAKGLPVSCAFAYMLAAPIVNPITIFSTWNAFPDFETWSERAEFFTFSRVLLGYLAAILVGLIVLRIPMDKILKPKVLPADTKKEKEHPHHDCDHKDCDHDHHHEHDDHHHGSEGQNRVVLSMRAALKDFTDVGVYFTIGVIITALFNVGIAPGAEWLESMEGSALGQTAAFMALAFLLSLCSTSDAFIAATLAPPAAARTAARLAFLVFGPMMDVKLLFLYSTIMKPKFIAWLAIGLFVFVGLTAVGWTAAMGQ
ncbi:MAG: permease [Roseibacillus sp.]